MKKHISKKTNKEHKGDEQKCQICFKELFNGTVPTIIGEKTGGKW